MTCRKTSTDVTEPLAHVLCHSSVRRLDHRFESRYMYFIELNMPGWIVSPLFSNSHITNPQEIAAKAVKYRESGGMGFTPDVEEDE